MKNSEINIPKDFCEKVESKVFDLATDSFEEIVKPTELEIKKYAQELIDYTNYLTNLTLHNNALEKSLSKTENPNTVFEFSKKMVVEKEHFKSLMNKVFTLQNKVNEFLGQKVQMVFTYIDKKTGEVTIYKVDNDIEHLTIDKASKSHGGAITGRYKYSKKTLNTMEKIINSNYDDSSLKSTFSEVYKRYTISKAKLNLKGAFLILWKENDKWDGVKVTSVGALGESYFNFYINEYIFSGLIDNRVKDFMINDRYGVIQGDSASGFLQGDVTKGHIEYGVKAQGASAMGYMEVLDYAKEIVQSNNLSDFLLNGKNGLKKRLQEAGNKNLAQRIQGELGQTIEDIVSVLNLE